MLWKPTTILRIFIFNRIQKPQYYTYVNFRIFEKLCKLRDIYIRIFSFVYSIEKIYTNRIRKIRENKKKRSLKSHYEKMQTKNNYIDYYKIIRR